MAAPKKAPARTARTTVKRRGTSARAQSGADGRQAVRGANRVGDHRDHVDSIVEQWRRERPDLDPTPMAIFGRISRVHALVRLAQNELYARHDMSFAAFDILANLRRSGKPHRKTASNLAESSMISTGGVTFRMDALESAGLIRRVRDREDRRVVHAELTAKGKATIDKVIEAHLELEHRMLTELSPSDCDALARLLTKLENSVADNDGRE